ncbi:phage holin family protein [Pseudomonas aeruginosa]
MLDALHGYRLNPVSPWLTLVLAILLGLVCHARGNLAHILRVY